MDIMQLSVFDKTLQESNLWLKAIMGSLGATKRDTAWDALKARPHTLCDRMGPENAVPIGAQLPMLIRGLHYDGWRPAATPTMEWHIEDFLDRLIGKLARNSRTDPEAAERAVFNAMR